VIGAGGGRDILSGLLVGAKDITAIEINSHTVDLMSSTFRDFSGDIYNVPGVHAVVDEGRSALTHTSKKFDLIQISLIDSWAASVAGAFALAENNLYTVEAFTLYGEKLTKDGLISISRWLSEMPRLIDLARASLVAMGIKNPARHIAVIGANNIGTLLVSLTPFGKADVDAIEEICEVRGFSQLYPVPTGLKPSNFSVATTAESGLTFLAHTGLNVSPPTDDSPYFFQLISPFKDVVQTDWDRIASLGLVFNVQSTLILRQTMASVVALALIMFILPFVARFNKQHRVEPVSLLLRATLFFAAIGFSFMLIENVLVQRFVLYLGHPSYATTVIIAGLLLGMGLGSTFAGWVGTHGLRRYGLGVPAVLLLLVLVVPNLFSATLGFSWAVRVTISVLILFPLGAAFGLFFPLGMLRFGDRAKPWYWAINGMFGVVASVMSLALSMEFGYTVVGLFGALGYVVAWACLLGKSQHPASVA
jgi:hypothetical protein